MNITTGSRRVKFSKRGWRLEKSREGKRKGRIMLFWEVSGHSCPVEELGFEILSVDTSDWHRIMSGVQRDTTGRTYGNV